MTNPIAQTRDVEDNGHHYKALVFWCPGCQIPDESEPGTFARGLHMLPVSGDSNGRPVWDWDGNLEAPTLSPSILTKSSWKGEETICHSYMHAGVMEFLGDCTHAYANQHVPLPPLPDWAVRMP